MRAKSIRRFPGIDMDSPKDFAPADSTPFSPDVRERRLEPEWMDQPGLDQRLHEQALRGLARINSVSMSVQMEWTPIRKLALASDGPVRVLDVACGGGEIAAGLMQRARKSGLHVQVDGCDMSEQALSIAAAAAGGSDANFFAHDALNGPLPQGYDVLTASAFLHHLERDEAVDFLSRAREAAGQMVLINDLERSTLGYLAAYFGSRALSRSPVVHYDAPRSVAAAFTRGELHDLAEQAGMEVFEITRHWPWRMRLIWQRD
jgi:2-polyprenyl-3-methyl-5-hydroxy-6-metoxy-1,4-benzoquinol methylase